MHNSHMLIRWILALFIVLLLTNCGGASGSGTTEEAQIVHTENDTEEELLATEETPDMEEVADMDIQSTTYAAINATSYTLENLAINTDETAPNYGAEYYVSPSGNDSNDGTINQPFATLTKARDTIRTVKSSTGLPSGGIIVWIRGGIYERSSTLAFDSQDSGELGKPIVYRRYSGEAPRVVGGKKLDPAWFNLATSGDEIWDRLDVATRSNIYVANLKSHGITDYGTLRKSSYVGDQLAEGPMELYVEGASAELARYPDKSSTTLLPDVDSSSITIYGTTTPVVAGTYIKQPDGTYNRDGLVDGKQYHLRKEIGTENIANAWVIGDTNSGIDYFGEWNAGFSLPKLLSENWNGSSGTLSFTEANTEQLGFAFITEGVTTSSFKYAGTRPENWASLDDVWLNGMLKHGWSNSHRKITSVTDGTITLESAPLYDVEIGTKPKAYYCYNIPEELTVPGEYYIDRVNGKLYYYPNGDIDSKELIVSTQNQAIVKFDGAEYIQFYGVTIEVGRKELVYMTESTSNIKFSKCTIRNNGQNLIEMYGNNNGFEYCELSGAGDTTIIINGGVRATLTNGNNYIKNSHIHSGGRWNHTFTQIQVKGCGNIIENNDIHDFMGQAIWFHGNEHSIQYNNIYDVMKFTEDAGVIYSGRHWDWRGNKIKYNFIHDIKHNFGETFLTGIYLDDTVSGNEISDNIFYNIDGFGIFLNGGRDNTINNNSFEKVATILGVTDHGKYHINNEPGSQWNLLERLCDDGVNYRSEPWAGRYPKLYAMPNNWTEIQNDGWLYAGGNSFHNNVATDYLRWREGGYRDFVENSQQINSFDSDPVAEDSPDFNPIPSNEIGIQPR